MRLASFEVNGKATYGILDGDMLREPGDGFLSRYSSLRAAIAAGAITELLTDGGGRNYAVDAVRFLPVIPSPDKVLCVGVNYRPHVEEMGRTVPEHPLVFVRFAGSQVGHGQPVIRPAASEQFDFEGELAVVIGKRTRHVSTVDALLSVAGYCCFMDGSVRDFQKHTTQFTPGKNFDRSGSMGPYLVTSDEIPDPTTLSLKTTVNGNVMQQGRVADLIFDIPTLIAYCSTFTELLPGDVIATGTPGGVGAARVPPVWLRDGDIVEVDISCVGRLSNSVRDEQCHSGP